MSRYLDSFTILDDGPKRETGAGLRDHPFHFDDTVSGPFSVALANARFIEKVNRVSYPEGIISTKIELNANAKDGKFRCVSFTRVRELGLTIQRSYDRDFLIQFMSVCKGKPPRFPDLGPLGLEPADQSQHDSYRGGSGRRTSSDMHSVALNLRTLVALDFGDLDDSSDLSMVS
jgi:translation initiation factor 4G